MSAAVEPLHVIEYSMDELRSILERAKDDALPEEDREKLGLLVESYALLLEEIKDKKASIERLRQLVFGAKTETKKNVKKSAGKASGTGGKKNPKKEISC